MHVWLQGLVRNQWHDRFIKGKAFRESTDKRARELDVIHRSNDTVGA
jgi:hypothetical protein